MGTNEKVLNKSFVDEIHERSSCAICQCILKGCNGGLQSVTCRNSSTPVIRETQGRVYSSSDGRLGRDSVLHSQEQQAGCTYDGIKEAKEKQMLRPDSLHKDCFIDSSSYYGGYNGLLQESMDDKIQIKVAVKELKKTEDPFDLYFTTRGNWWEGSLYY